MSESAAGGPATRVGGAARGSPPPSPPASALATQMHAGLLTVLVLTLVLGLALDYSVIRARYDWLYQKYGTALMGRPNKAAPVSIGPGRIVLAYERPWLAQLVQARPLSMAAATFLMRLVKYGVHPDLLLSGVSGSVDRHTPPSADALRNAVSSLEAWTAMGKADDPARPPIPAAAWLAMNVPYNSALVAGYRAQLGMSALGSPSGDLSLLILWLYGCEEYVRERFSSGATSALSEWNFMLGAGAPAAHALAGSSLAPATGGGGCDAVSMAYSIGSTMVGTIGVGAMFAPPFGAIGGAVAGIGLGLLGKASCL